MDYAAENETPLEESQQDAVATDSDAIKASKPEAVTVLTPKYEAKFPKLIQNYLLYATFSLAQQVNIRSIGL